MTWVWHLDFDLDLVTGLWYTHFLNVGSIFILKVQRTSMSFKFFFGTLVGPGGSWLGFGIFIFIWICPGSLDLGLWRTLKVPDLGLASWSWFGYGHWSLIHPFSWFWPSILILKVQKTSLSFKSCFGALEDAGFSWLGFCILILSWIWSMVFGTPIFQNLAHYLDVVGAKNIHVLKVLIMGFGGYRRFLIGFWHLGHYFNRIIGLS